MSKKLYFGSNLKMYKNIKDNGRISSEISGEYERYQPGRDRIIYYPVLYHS